MCPSAGLHRGHMPAWIRREARLCRAQSPSPRFSLPSACLPADPPASLTACLPFLATAAPALTDEGPPVGAVARLGEFPLCLDETAYQYSFSVEGNRKAVKMVQWTDTQSTLPLCYSSAQQIARPPIFGTNIAHYEIMMITELGQTYLHTVE